MGQRFAISSCLETSTLSKNHKNEFISRSAAGLLVCDSVVEDLKADNVSSRFCFADVEEIDKQYGIYARVIDTDGKQLSRAFA